MQEFAQFAATLKGSEKSDGQTFLFHLLEAFSHDPNTLPENSRFEYRVRFPGERAKFADFVWPGRVLIEMKSRGTKLSQHRRPTSPYPIANPPGLKISLYQVPCIIQVPCIQERSQPTNINQRIYE